jgi:hypothetical protein
VPILRKVVVYELLSLDGVAQNRAVPGSPTQVAFQALAARTVPSARAADVRTQMFGLNRAGRPGQI